MRSTKYPFVIAFSLLAILSCRKIEKLPAEPSIKFTSFEVLDTSDILGNSYKAGRLKFYFQDGDGDLGLQPPVRGLSADSTNLFFTLFRKTEGIFVPVADDDPLKPSDYRIPYMERQGQNKILKGTIAVTFLYIFNSSNDTLKYEFYIKDRAGNSSNSVSTCELALKVNSICTHGDN